MKVVSLFSGAGGLDKGFEKEKFKIIWANENDKHIIETFRENFPSTKLVTESITDVKLSEIPECDGIIGGPPCQSWSAAGSHRGKDDPRGQLFLQNYIKVVNNKKPKFFLAENVPGLKYSRHAEAYSSILKQLKRHYVVSDEIYDSFDYGVAQKRKRLIIVGYRKDLNINFSKPKELKNKYLKDVIKDLERNAVCALGNKKTRAATTNPKVKIANHEYMYVNEEKNSFHYMSRNRVRSWDEPSFTIPASGRHVPQHPSAPKMVPVFKNGKKVKNVMEFDKTYKSKLKKYRRLTVRECARIQGFPDEFIFYYQNLDHGYKMIGNAVPVTMAQAFARQIALDLKNIG